MAEITQAEILQEGLDQLQSAEANIAAARRILSFNGFDHISSRCYAMKPILKEAYRLIQQEMDEEAG